MPDDPRPGNVRQHPTARRRAPHPAGTDVPTPPPTPPRRRVGRPSLLNDQTTDTIAGALRIGVPFREAAALAGVSEQAAHNWKRWGEEALADAGFVDGMEYDADAALATIPEDRHRFVEFWWAIQATRAARRAALLDKMARSNDVRATMFLLRTGWPDDYGDRLTVESTVEVVDPAAALRERIARLRPGVIDVASSEVDEAAPAPTPARRRRTGS